MDTEDEADPKIAIDARKLHLLSDSNALALFDTALGSGSAWRSSLMQYRTTSEFQRDWKIEVGNWLERARQLGFLPDVLGNVVPQRSATGARTADDPVHRNVTQRLAQVMVAHYFAGTGWQLHAWEPRVSEQRGSGIAADVDIQLAAPDASIVDLQVKASGSLGIHENEANSHIQNGVRKAAAQLPSPGTRPALIVMCAQRGWWLSADIDVLEEFIGNTIAYGEGPVLLHESDRGAFKEWPHISGIVVLDYRRSTGFDYSCVVLQNPWALHRLDPAWFPYARVLMHAESQYRWLRGQPAASTFPPGTRDFAGTKDDALRRIYGAR